MGNITFKFYSNVKDLRIERRWTQEDLAKQAGCARVTISRIESGNRIPSLDLAYQISYAFEKRVDEVFPYIVESRKEVS